MKKQRKQSARTKKKISLSLRNRKSAKLKNYGARGAAIGGALGGLGASSAAYNVMYSPSMKKVTPKGTRVKTGIATTGAAGAIGGAASGALIGSGYNRLRKSKSRLGKIVGGALLGTGVMGGLSQTAYTGVGHYAGYLLRKQ